MSAIYRGKYGALHKQYFCMNADPDSSVAQPDPAELCKLQTQENPAQQNCVSICDKIPLSRIREIIFIIILKQEAVCEYEHVYDTVPTGILSADKHDLQFLMY